MKTRLLAVGYGRAGFQSFATGDKNGPFWPGELYRDEEKNFFHAALGGRRRGSRLSLCSSQVVRASRAATAANIFSASRGGDYFNLGGVLVAAAGHCVYVERQNGFADEPTYEQLVASATKAAADMARRKCPEGDSK